MTLADLKTGQKGRITGIGSAGPVKRRLMDMGIVVGAEAQVEKVAPLGDPIELKIKGYNLSLRREEARGISVEAV
jgi:ferrous iron transport protein A